MSSKEVFVLMFLTCGLFLCCGEILSRVDPPSNQVASEDHGRRWWWEPSDVARARRLIEEARWLLEVENLEQPVFEQPVNDVQGPPLECPVPDNWVHQFVTEEELQLQQVLLDSQNDGLQPLAIPVEEPVEGREGHYVTEARRVVKDFWPDRNPG